MQKPRKRTKGLKRKKREKKRNPKKPEHVVDTRWFTQTKSDIPRKAAAEPPRALPNGIIHPPLPSSPPHPSIASHMSHIARQTGSQDCCSSPSRRNISSDPRQHRRCTGTEQRKRARRPSTWPSMPSPHTQFSTRKPPKVIMCVNPIDEYP